MNAMEKVNWDSCSLSLPMQEEASHKTSRRQVQKKSHKTNPPTKKHTTFLANT